MSNERDDLLKLLGALRERCAEEAENTIVASYEGTDEYGSLAAVRIRQIELDVAVDQYLKHRTASDCPSDGPTFDAAKILEYAKQAQSIPGSVSTIEPIPMTPLQLAFVVGKLVRDYKAPDRSSHDEVDLSKCPGCDGYADNGHDRCIPPSPYYCTKCNASMAALAHPADAKEPK